MGSAPLRTTDAIDHADENAMQAWVRAARDGDSRAFERVYRAHVGRVYALCLRMTGDAREAEERTQDAFVRAWEKLPTFRGDARFGTWMHRLTVNLVLQNRRSRGRRRKREESAPDMERFDRAVTVAMPGTRVDLERAIQGLPPGAREVLILRDIQGYKYQEIADMTGVALGTVKAQIHRARSLVREALER